jgi:hypothetical protein
MMAGHVRAAERSVFSSHDSLYPGFICRETFIKLMGSKGVRLDCEFVLGS